MFYVYCEADYAVYEPAEGGYYVRCSEITECHEFCTLEDAYAELLTMVMQAEEDGDTVSGASWDCGFKTFAEDLEEPETHLVFPWVRYNKTGYIGDGFELAISAEKPSDSPYEGYC